MIAASATTFGSALLRTSGPRSSIFDLWYGQLLPDQNGPICLIRRMLPPYSQAPDYVHLLEERLNEIHRFSHASVLLPRYWQVQEGAPYLLLEAPTGYNLQDVLKECLERQVPIPVDLVLQWIYPVTHALASAHSRPQKPLVHGALRPSAIWLEEDGRPRLGDFEIGALAEFDLRGSHDFELNGWRCLPPERQQSWENPPPGCDVYGVAAILLEMLCVGRTSEVQYQSGIQDRLAVLHARHLPMPLLKLIARAHADETSERPSMSALMDGLKEVGQQTPSTSPPGQFLAQLSPFRSDLAAQAHSGALEAYIRQQPRRGFEPDKQDHQLPVMAQAPQTGGSSRRSLVLALVVLLLLVGVGVAARDPLKALLSPKPPATLELTSEPSNAAVTTREGAPIGFTPLSLPVTVGGGGELELIVQHPGYEPQTLKLVVDAGGRMVGHVELVRSARAGAAPSASAGSTARPAGKRSGEREGSLLVTSSTPAQIDVDGNPFGDTSNAGRIKLTPGRHSVELRPLAGGSSVQYDVRVVAGKVLSLHYDFDERRWRMGERPADAGGQTEGEAASSPEARPDGASQETQAGTPAAPAPASSPE
ncbi:MAG: hypothetical protein ACKO6N_28200 [Myxococcota bacterium]